MGRSRQYKILYEDGSLKEVKTTDFWCFSNNDISLKFSDGKQGIDFDYLRTIYPAERLTIAIIEDRFTSGSPGTSFRKDLDNLLRALCSNNSIDRDIDKKNYEKLRSLFGMDLINHSTYAFPLFKLDEKDKEFYSLPFTGNRQAYSNALFTILHHILILHNIDIWGVIPFYLDDIRDILCSYIFPFSSADTQAKDNFTIVLRFKNQKQLEQDCLFINNIIDQYRMQSLLVNFPAGYKKFRHGVKNFINAYRKPPAKLTYKETNELKKCFDCINTSRDISSALENLAKHLEPIRYVVEKNPDAFDIIDAVFTKSVGRSIKSLYREMFTFMSWVNETQDLIIADSKVSHEDIDQLFDTYYDLFSAYDEYYFLSLTNLHRLAINPHQIFE